MQDDMKKRIEEIRDAANKPSFSFNLAKYFRRISDISKIKRSKSREERQQKETLSALRQKSLNELERALKNSIDPDTEAQRIIFWVSHFDIEIQKVRGVKDVSVYTTRYKPDRLSKERFLFVQLSPSEAIKIDFNPRNKIYSVTKLIGHRSIFKTGWREDRHDNFEDKDLLIDEIKHAIANAVVENEIDFPRRAAWLAAKRLSQAGLVFVFLRSCGPDVFAEDIHTPNNAQTLNGDVLTTFLEPTR